MTTQQKPAHPVLSCRDLVVGYPGTEVITDINLSFEAGHFITLLGPNGAGKTTLLRTLTRHLQPIAGDISVGNRPLKSLKQTELARIMAVVLTDKVTPPLFTVFQFVALGRYPHTDFLGRLSENDADVVTRSLAAVHADELTDRDFASLSDGERQKVLVARALAQEPEILLLDEPTAHLDLKHRVEVMAILRDLCRSKGITVIASLHDVDIAAKVSDRVVLVKNGHISHWGYPEEVLTTEVVAELYDFHSASFSHQLGSIEIRGSGHRGKAFVVAGMGSGATVFRMLVKRGYSICTGVLQQNDLDSFVAAGLGAACISQPPGESISDEGFQKALELMSGCDLVIDAGFSTDGIYRRNFRLIEQAVHMGKPIFSLREDVIGDLPSGVSDTIISAKSISQLFEVMESHE